ncbi:MAG: hypothetical protein AAGK37_21070 [Pseudomonadota bacterium]
MTMWWLNLAGSSVGFTLGSLLLKRFADTGGWTVLSFSFAIFAVSNLLFAQVLRGGLGQGIVASSMLQIILMATLGVLIFDEKLSILQIAGVALAVTSIFLILGPGPIER